MPAEPPASGPSYHSPAVKRLSNSRHAKAQLDQVPREKPQERLHPSPHSLMLSTMQRCPLLGAGRQNVGGQHLEFTETAAAIAASLRAGLQIGFDSHGQQISLMETGAMWLFRTHLFRRNALQEAGSKQPLPGSEGVRQRRSRRADLAQAVARNRRRDCGYRSDLPANLRPDAKPLLLLQAAVTPLLFRAARL